MKKIVSITAAVAVVAMAGSAFAAATTATLSTSATVLAACKATPGDTIDFGTLDPINDTLPTKNASTKGTVTVQCTDGTAYGFAYDNAATMQVGGAGVAIPVYPVADLPAVNVGTVAGTTHSVDAQVKLADYSNAPAGAYTGTYTLTITY